MYMHVSVYAPSWCIVVPDDFKKTHQYEQGNAYQITNPCPSVQEAKSSAA
jgi:hypothetical protein